MASVTSWQIDAAHSSVEFAVKHMMFTTVRGRFKTISGTVHVDEQNPDRSSVEADIEASSIDTGVEDRDQHLRSGDFLDVERHPRITFRSTRVEGAHAKGGDRFRLIGELTIRGRTLPVTLNAVFEGIGKDPWGHQRAGFGATVEIDRREWGLMWNQALETGGVLVGHSIKIELDVQAVKQEAKGQAVA